jgi:two-component system, chemotaxis family, response regulator Rcp1
MAERVRIFLAEDNPSDVMLIEEALKRRSLAFELDHFTTAEQAIDAAQSCGSEGQPVPDLILLDYNLPRGNGSEVLAAAAKNPRLADVPKAILSSSLRPAEIQEARRLGAVRFITKPAELEDFFKEVGTAVAELLKQGGRSATT